MKKSSSKKVPSKRDRVVAPPVIIKRARIDNENDQYQFGIDEDEANDKMLARPAIQLLCGFVSSALVI